MPDAAESAVSKSIKWLAYGAAVAVRWTLLLVCDREVVEQARHAQNLCYQGVS